MKGIIIWMTLIWSVASSYSQINPKDTNQIDAKGLKQGVWKRYDKDGLRYEGQFKNDKPYGIFKYYYPGHKLQTRAEYSRNAEISKTISYYSNGKVMSEGMYWKQKKDSIWRYYNEADTLIAEESYSKGVKHGAWKTYSVKGKLLKLETFVSDFHEGEMAEYFENGHPKIKANYAKNTLDGVYKLFYPNGKVRISGEYSHGAKVGPWVSYRENGQNSRMEKYLANKVVEDKVYFNLPNKPALAVSVDSIAYMYTPEDQSFLVLKSGHKELISNSLDEMEEILGDVKFFRINPQLYIKLSAIKSVEKYSAKEVKVILNPPCEIDAVANEDKSAILKSWNYK